MNTRFLALVISIFSTPVVAAEVIDQHQESNDKLISSGFEGELVQSFTPAASNISGAGVYIEGGFSLTTISVWDNFPGRAGADLLAFGSVAESPTFPNYTDVFFNPVAITSGKTYYLVVSTTDPSSNFKGGIGDPYSGGAAYAYNGASQPQELVGADLAFRTFAAVSPLPELGTWTLFIGGFGMMGAAIRRKKARVTFA